MKYKNIYRFLLISGLIPVVILFMNKEGNQAEKGLINLGEQINSVDDDFSPSITEDGRTMLFNSKRGGKNDHDIYVTRFENNRWSKPEPFDLLNSPENDETPFISADGNIILFASDREGSIRPSVTADGKVRITYDIYMSRFTNGIWSKPERLPGDVNTTWNERAPALSTDNTTLYFTRWPYKNLKDACIMAATRSNGSFSDVKKMPAPINTGNYEISCVPSKKKTGFYVSSRRPGGFGGWDIYFIEYKNRVFGNAVNLGEPFNSPDNEMFIAEYGDLLYLCSNRIGGIGKYDIYASRKQELAKPKVVAPEAPERTEKPKTPVETSEKPKTPAEIITPEKLVAEKKPTGIIHVEKAPVYPRAETEVVCTVVKKGTGEPASASFEIFLKDTDNPRKPEIRKMVMKSGEKGEILFKPKGDITHVVLKTSDDSYLPMRKQIKVDPNTVNTLTIEVTPAAAKTKYAMAKTEPALKDFEQKKVKTKDVPAKNEPKQGKCSELKNFNYRPLFFAYNSSYIGIGYYQYLNKIANYLRCKDNIRLIVTGHTDTNGAENSNEHLSLSRAKAVTQYFIGLGLEVKRFEVRGMGSKDPILPKNGFDVINRRVEFQEKE